MNLKKVEIYGFKSFADKLEIVFESGITVIVGPNGCGKSNVVDAVRWVLGEQSSKVLRGKSMADFIFNGTEKRKSLSYCEVSLFFDNADRLIPLDYSEVVISRKLYKDGESEYLINKTPTRLKVISDLLRDSGMGREGYSIISQGKIDEILSVKPDDRRAIFEEATGISKFKQRKIETERKLERTTENLITLSAVLSELERQLAPLEKQSQDAKKFLELKHQQMMHEINIYISQYDTAAGTKKAISAKLDGIKEELNLKQKLYDEAFMRYEDSVLNITNTDRNISELRDRKLELTVGLEKQAGEIKLQQERIGFLLQQNQRLNSEAEALADEITVVEKDLADKQSRLTVVSEDLKNKKYLADSLNEEYMQLVNNLALSQELSETSHRQMINTLKKHSDVKSVLAAYKQEKTDSQALLVDAEQKKTEILNLISENSNQILQTQALIEMLNSNKEKINAKRSQLSAEYNKLNSQLKECDANLLKMRSMQSSAETKHKMYTQMQENYEGFSYAVKQLMADAKHDITLSSRIEGVVAAVIKVPQKLETAIEAALGQASQNIITTNDNNAKHIINYLKEKRYGRLTFLPISSVLPRRLDIKDEAVLREKDCLGIASELISYDLRFFSVMAGLLGNTVIVKDMDTAVSLSKKYGCRFKIVTLDGEIISRQGAITGGSFKGEAANKMSYEREKEAAKVSLKELEQNISAANVIREQIIAEQESLAAEIKSISDKVHAIDIDAAKNQQRLAVLNTEATEMHEQVVAQNNLAAKIKLGLKEIDSKINRLSDEDQQMATNQQNNSDDIEKQQEEYNIYREKRDQMHDKITNIKIDIASLQAELNALNIEISRLKYEHSSAIDAQETAKASILRNDETIAEAQKFTAAHAETDKEQAELSQISQRLSNLDSYKENLENVRNAADRQRIELNTEINKINEKKQQEEYNLSRIDTELDMMQERINEEYHHTYSSALQYKIEDYDMQKGQQDLSKLRRQILSLGYVNVNAIEDYKTTKDLYDLKATQRDDLEKARADLTTVITQLTDEMVGRFKTGFDIINKNFSTVFKELFGGGKARLILDDSQGEDLLSAGIDIEAEPPGKRLQHISLLSGGERALTAIAILFAILKMRPMPFCVLDEIEASLDDANAERFARYLKKFSHETQFIVITHRKPTMELADALYGVTMEEKGVSRIVSVRLSEAAAMADNA